MKLQADGFKTILRNIGTSENKRKSESEAILGALDLISHLSMIN